jgi:hypothetical protein
MRIRIAIILCMMMSYGVIAQAQQISQGGVRLVAVKAGGDWTGFNLYHHNLLITQVKLSSNGLLTAGVCKTMYSPKRLMFTSLQSLKGSGLSLGKRDYIEIALTPGDYYPQVKFRITLRSFNPNMWLRKVGKSPFHFLSLYMPDAMAWHIQGWLNATPYTDPFPLLIDPHGGTPEISAYKYNRNWSYTPPLGAQSVPIIGLWEPQKSLYAGFEFATTRLEDNTEKNIATAYCWKESLPGISGKVNKQFVSLVFPYGGPGFQQLVFPHAGDVLYTHCRLIWSDRLPGTKDPNELLWNYVWRRDKSLLPRVPLRENMSWMPGQNQLTQFQGPPTGGVIYRTATGDTFHTPGTTGLSGWGAHNESMVDAPVKNHDMARVISLENEARELVAMAKWFRITAAGESPKQFIPSYRGTGVPSDNIGVYWDQPVTGSWTVNFGGKAVASYHNSNGWAAGRLLIDLFRDRHDTQYLPYIDGVFNWTRSIVWTRNEFPDVPSSPFAIGGTLSAAFCLDYYHTFRNDPLREKRAQEALQMARSFAYRYLTMWAGDNNRDDNLDSSFLWEPNSGRDWTGAACANEVMWDLDTLAQTAVDTGDPILMYALQGSLSRWHVLYRDEYYPSLKDYPSGDMSECYGLYEGCNVGPGNRTVYGFASPLAMTFPVGDTLVRVLAGDKAAMAFDKDGAHTYIDQYRYQPSGNFSFRIRSTLTTPFNVSITCPYVDLSEKPVTIMRNGKKIKLREGKGFLRQSQAVWDLIVNKVRNGDTVIVGTPSQNAPGLPSVPPLTDTHFTAKSQPLPSGFKIVPFAANIRPDDSWQHLSSWAGLSRGLRWFWGVPFLLSPASEKSALHGRCTLHGVGTADRVFVLYSLGAGKTPEILFADGKHIQLHDNLAALAWRAWPPIYTSRILMGWADTKGRKVEGVSSGNRLIFAITAVKGKVVNEIALRKGAEEWANIRRQDALIASLKRDTTRIPKGSFAILPFGGGGAMATMLGKLQLNAKAADLSPELMVDPAVLNPKKILVLLDLDGENYIRSVRHENDARNALIRYVRQGGTLILMTSQPWPLCYGVEIDNSAPAAEITSALGLPLYVSIEKMPQDKLKVLKVHGETLLPGIPKEYAYPEGDPRLRSISRAGIASNVQYQPLVHVVGASGTDYGDAAGLITFPNGGRILYISDVLTNDPQYGSIYIVDALKLLSKWTQR